MIYKDRIIDVERYSVAKGYQIETALTNWSKQNEFNPRACDYVCSQSTRGGICLSYIHYARETLTFNLSRLTTNQTASSLRATSNKSNLYTYEYSTDTVNVCTQDSPIRVDMDAVQAGRFLLHASPLLNR